MNKDHDLAQPGLTEGARKEHGDAVPETTSYWVWGRPSDTKNGGKSN